MSVSTASTRHTLLTSLDIEFVEQGKQRVVARMPVGPKVHQPFGILHGGASVALAETVASTGGWLNVDQSKETVVGLEINANHLRAKRDGVVTAVATPDPYRPQDACLGNQDQRRAGQAGLYFALHAGRRAAALISRSG